MIREAHKIPEDCKEEIREMYADGLTVRNIAYYIGLQEIVVRYILDINGQKKRQQEASTKWRLKNPEAYKIIQKRGAKNYALRQAQKKKLGDTITK